MISNYDLKQLRKIYSNNRLVPFIGTGLSKPYDIPDWAKLLNTINDDLISEKSIHELIKEQIQNGRYWEAIDDIIEYSFKDEEFIQKMASEIVNEKVIDNYQSIDSNYRDLGKLRVPFYLTTNYDNYLGRHIDSKYQPTILNDSTSSTQLWNSESAPKRIFHLHGDIANHKSIVLTKGKYDEVYSSPKYINLFNFIRSGYTFLFMGFSFADQYMCKLLTEYNTYYGDYHYMLLANATDKQKQDYMDKYHVTVINYEVKDITNNQEHIQGIRKILEEISKDEEVVNF